MSPFLKKEHYSNFCTFKIAILLRPGICGKNFLSFPQKNLWPEKTEIANCLLFNFLSDKIYSYIKNSHFTTSQFSKIGALVYLITQKWKSKHLAISVFSGQRFFWGNERKYFQNISGLNVPGRYSKKYGILTFRGLFQVKTVTNCLKYTFLLKIKDQKQKGIKKAALLIPNIFLCFLWNYFSLSIKAEGMTQFDIFHVFVENSVNSDLYFFWALLKPAKIWNLSKNEFQWTQKKFWPLIWKILI